MLLMNIYLLLIEIDCTIVESIFKLWENTSFFNYNMNDEGRNKYQVTLIFKENVAMLLINTEQMVFNEHIFVIPYSIYGKTLLFIMLTSPMMAEINAK